MDNKEVVNEQDLDKVVGGLFDWYPNYNVMIYTHPDGSQTRHTILDYKEGWKLSNQLHGEFVSEDEILKKLIQAGYIAG